MRYWNSIIADFEQESIHLPFIVEPGIDGIPGRAWARGFLKGTRLAPEGWSDLWDSEGDGQLLSVSLVAGELDPTWPTEALTKEKEDELLQWMFAGAARAYRHFADARREFADARYDDAIEEEVDDYYPRDVCSAGAEPTRAGLDRFVNLDAPADFIGKAALLKVREQGITRKLVGIRILGDTQPAAFE